MNGHIFRGENNVHKVLNGMNINPVKTNFCRVFLISTLLNNHLGMIYIVASSLIGWPHAQNDPCYDSNKHGNYDNYCVFWKEGTSMFKLWIY